MTEDEKKKFLKQFYGLSGGSALKKAIGEEEHENKKRSVTNNRVDKSDVLALNRIFSNNKDS